MLEPINEFVSIKCIFNPGREIQILALEWKNKKYQVEKIGLHHTYYKGKKLYHIYCLKTDSFFCRLRFDSESLVWLMEELDNGC